MSILRIEGGHGLSGSVAVHGSKNAVLPMMAASVLYSGTTVIYGVPRILDVLYMIEILETLGCRVDFQRDILIIDASNIRSACLPSTLTGKMRSSVFLLGPLLTRCREAYIGEPGGCSIGKRPIDMHLAALMQMGAEVKEEDGWIQAFASDLHGSEIKLPFPSVGATENVVMAAVKAKGQTLLKNAAREPEVVDFCRMLLAMGADIKGIGSSTLLIQGVSDLHACEFHVSGDRIEAATYLIAGAACKGEILITNTNAGQLASVLSALSVSGCDILQSQDAVCIRRKDRLRAVPCIRTAPFPGFPTDVQSQMMALLSMAEGQSVIQENIFEARFQTALELQKMGADITIERNRAIVKGVPGLFGTKVSATDLRGGAALVIAALAAEGTTEIHNCTYIYRGYHCLEEQLSRLGAAVHRISASQEVPGAAV